ncbi:unnamed protein product [Musa acuminata subsp. burmannicoides]
MLSQEKNHVMTCGNRGGAWRSREWPKRIHFMVAWDPFYSVAGTSCARFTWRPSSEPNSSLQKPSFELSGKLAEETNRVQGVTLLFNELANAHELDINGNYMFSRLGKHSVRRGVADIPTDHPSCSKQHAVIQYRLVEKEQPDGLTSKQVRPYLMDLGSTNGTFIDDNHIEPQHSILNLKRILLGLAMVARNMYHYMRTQVEKPTLKDC